MEAVDIIIIIALGIQSILLSYFGEKSRNLATKKDIKVITRRVEEVKDEFLKGQTKFNKLHEIRIDVLRELSKKLRVLYSDMHDELSELHNTDKKSAVYRKIILILKDFRDYHEDNEIFFDDDFNIKLIEIYNKYFKSASEIKIGAETEDRYNIQYDRFEKFGIPIHESEDKLVKAMARVDKGWDLIWNEIPKFQKELKDETKKILGSISSE